MMIEAYEFKEGDKVLVTHLGPNYPVTFRGIIRGISGPFNKIRGWNIFIVEALDKIPDMPDYSHYTITDACISLR